MRKRFLTGPDVDTDVIPNYLRELADAVENNDIVITSIKDCSNASENGLAEREHRLSYSTTSEGIDLFNTALIQLSDVNDRGDDDE